MPTNYQYGYWMNGEDKSYVIAGLWPNVMWDGNSIITLACYIPDTSVVNNQITVLH